VAEFERLDIGIDEITGKPEKNCLIIVSDGKVKKMNVPDFAQITLRSQDGKIQVVETTTKEKF
jgi:hypothetical protein